MDNTKRLENIINDLNSPRSYIRRKAVDDLMSIRQESFIPILFKKMNQQTAFVRVQFCRFLGKIKSELAVPPLVVLLLDKNDLVAAEASRALEKNYSEKKSDELTLLVKRKVSRFPRLFAIKSLGAEGISRAVPYLINLLSSEDQDIKELTIEALRQIGEPVVISPLVRLLDDKNEKIVHSVLVVIAEIGEHSNGKNIIRFLEHKNAGLRQAAVWALTRLNYTKAMPDFISMLKSDTQEDVRAEIAKRLGKIGGSEAARALILAKAFDKAHNVRMYAEWSLREISLKDKESVLRDLAKSEDKNIRAEAILELGKTGDVKFFDLLHSAFKEDKSDCVRVCATEGLSFIPKKEAKDVLKEALKESEDISRRAADSLYRLTEPRDANTALDMTSGDLGQDDYIRNTGLKMIEKIYSDKGAPQDALDTLHKTLKKVDADAQKLIIKCLGRVGDKSSISLLRGLKGAKGKGALAQDVAAAVERIEKR